MNKSASHRKLLRIALLGVLAALTFAGNYARIILPISVGGNTAFTLGNVMCVLDGLLLGPVGGLAAGIGAALYDMTNPLYINEVPFTFLNKLVMGLLAGVIARGLRRKEDGREPASYPRCLLAAAAGCAGYYALYFLKSYFYNGLLLQALPGNLAWVAVLEKIPASVFNAAIAVIAAPPLAAAIRAALRKSNLSVLD